MTYSLTPGFINNVYSTYSVILAIGIAVFAWYSRKYSDTYRQKAVGNRITIMVAFLFVGMFFDTFFPYDGI